MNPSATRLSGGQELRILLVEDSPTDADLIIREIRRLGMAPAFRLVQDEDGYRRALLTFRPHIVLADHKLPRFSGRRALKLARTYDPELPVILVTGTLPERKVLRLVKLGLANYVFKDGMPRLGPAVVQALDRSLARQKEAEARRHAEQLERRLLSVTRASGDGILMVDSSRRISFWNEAAARMLGFAPAEAIGLDAASLIGAADRERFQAFWPEAAGAPSPLPPFTVKLSARRRDGVEFPVELSVASWDDQGERHFSAFLRDITQSKAEARERNLLSRALAQAGDLVIITDPEARIEYVNASFERITGYAAGEVIGQNPRVLQGSQTDRSVYGRMWSELVAGRNFTTEFMNRRKDGSEYLQRSSIFPIFDEAGRVDRYVGIGQDVTNERQMERHLRQAQKMEAVGQLTGGVAHDFNNLLTAIIGQAQILQEELPPEHAREGEPLPEMLAAAGRAADLVRRLMVFSRDDKRAAQVVDVRRVLDEVVSMVARVLPESIELRVEHAPDPLPCKVDPGSLQQAVLNLLNNARDAMPDGGTLTLRSRAAARPSGAAAAVIEVVDTGVGIPPEALDRVFEPFYTTKPAGKGTGLGLAMVYGFAQNSAGSVDVRSRPGTGTTFALHLPLAAPHASRHHAAETDTKPSGNDRARRGEVVLFAEDQKEIRELAQQILQRLGYEVITAADGTEARAVLAARKEQIDLVVTDLVMPGGGGVEVYHSTATWQRRPRFLFSSGYAPPDQEEDLRVVRSHPFLEKPWGIADFARAVRSALEA
ncbi:MAG TPA: PAS domain S-box protein [Longimicrobiales bacterium]|nr:PAS domain S-box protein [Longimicrobiales bacterium]